MVGDMDNTGSLNAQIIHQLTTAVRSKIAIQVCRLMGLNTRPVLSSLVSLFFKKNLFIYFRLSSTSLWIGSVTWSTAARTSPPPWRWEIQTSSSDLVLLFSFDDIVVEMLILRILIIPQVVKDCDKSTLYRLQALMRHCIYFWSGILVGHYLQSITPALALGGELVYHRRPGEEGTVTSFLGRYTGKICTLVVWFVLLIWQSTF